jgi:hypothetical protein
MSYAHPVIFPSLLITLAYYPILRFTEFTIADIGVAIRLYEATS